MHVIKRKALIDFWERPGCEDAQPALEAWYREAKTAHWNDPADIKSKYGTASTLKGGRVVFNIRGNKYRLIVEINYKSGVVYIRFIGTHREYDDIDAELIK
ncbi:type II toxin-antitoxin system HigB family toxin [Pararhodospirillum oryzae]|uniref:Toxin RelE n=1 Tax=Pararhodospirillum oryzae TaxID=478448 RepID=A0A512H3M0_9PROT|nr:type II toxin-antitoxin system HigB family toxin [Pararhodospirillum oryzae]GEO80059.1 toxin RelE [Pararhodospirillum oryzae]